MQISMKQARVGIDATLSEMANKMGVHVQTYTKLEQNPHTITIDQAKDFAEIVGVDLENIFFGDVSILNRPTLTPQTQKNPVLSDSVAPQGVCGEEKE